MEEAVTEYLHDLKIPVSKAYCRKLITSHADYPSILSVADSLERLGINHMIAKVSQKDLQKISFPYMLHLENAGGELISIKNSKILEIYKEKLQHWSGVILQAQPTDIIADTGNQKARAEEKQLKLLSAVLMTAVAGLILAPLSTTFSWQLLFFLFTSVTGIIVSYFLFAKELGVTFKTVESFCNAGNIAGCRKVLNAKEGKLFGVLKFSDASIIYFIVQFILTGFLVPFGTGNPFLTILAGLSVLSIPLVLYSLYLQSVKIKTWCRLCLLISGILITQVFLLLYLFGEGLIQPVQNILPAGFISALIFAATGASVFGIKKLLQRARKAEQNEIKANKIKYSPEVFTHLLLQQRKVDTSPLEREFTLGRVDAPIQLTIVVNLYCAPCKSEIEQALELLSLYPEKVNVTLRFLRSGDEGKASGYFLRSWLQQQSEKGHEPKKVRSLIKVWYDVMNLDEFKRVYPHQKKLESNSEQILRQQYEWIQKARIKKTPTTFLNSMELPEQYRVKDLFPLIPGLLELFSEQRMRNAKLAAEIER